MNKFILTVLIAFASLNCAAQNIEEIFFNLYTDSLKKGTANYINVEGKMSNGRYKPLTNKELSFLTSYGSFEGNDLLISFDYKQDSCILTVWVTSNPKLKKTMTIFIKKMEDPDLPNTTEAAKPTAKPAAKVKKKRKKTQ